MPFPLLERQEHLAQHLQLSGAFPDPVKLLKTCERMGLEGIVSKRADSAYRPGPTKDWLKIKTAAWRAANTDWFELLNRIRS